ncbi:MAG: TRAP transporter small permease [Candidatus Eiseniibacteriota bacterium]
MSAPAGAGESGAAPAAIESRAGRLLDRALSTVLALDMLAMLALTFVDVLGRYVFNAPVPGSFEIVSFMMAGAIAAGLPVVTQHREHIAVNLFDGVIHRSPALRRIQGVAISLVSACVVGFMTWRIWFEALDLTEGRQQTGFLKLPLAPVAYGITVMFALTTLILVAQVVAALGARRMP